MKRIFEVIATVAATVSIIDGKELSALSLLFDVQSHTHPIFVVISTDSRVSIDGVGFHCSIGFARYSCWLELRSLALFPSCSQHGSQSCLLLLLHSSFQFCAF